MSDVLKMSDVFELVFVGLIGGVLTLSILFFIVGGPIIGPEGVAKRVCESHGLEVDYYEGSDKVVCQEKPEDLSNKKVFEFDT